MTDETRKALTEYIGECWHEHNGIQTWECRKCGKRLEDEAGHIILGHVSFVDNDIVHENADIGELNRTFTTPDDIAAAVRRTIIKKGEWADFEDFCIDKWNDSVAQPAYSDLQWLTDPETFCQVAGEWVKMRGAHD